MIRVLADSQGRVQWLRPQPGYALWALGPAALAYAEGWTFEPATVGGSPMPAIFQLTVNSKLQHP